MMSLFVMEIPAQYQWVIYAGAFCAVMVILFRPRRAKPDSTSEKSLRPHRETEQQLQRLMVELSEMSRQIDARLEARAAKLETLLKEADAKIAAIQSLNDAPSQFDADAGAALDSTVDPDARYEQVYALCDQGRSPRQIADELHRPIGEIELILALRATH